MRCHTCDMTHSYLWHDSFVCVTWLIRMCDMTHSYLWHDSFVSVTWLIHICDVIAARSDPHQKRHRIKLRCCYVTHMNGSSHTYEWIMSYIRMSHVTRKEWVMSHVWHRIKLRCRYVTRMNGSCHTYGWIMSYIRMSHVTHMAFDAMRYHFLFFDAARTLIYMYVCMYVYVYVRMYIYVCKYTISILCMYTSRSRHRIEIVQVCVHRNALCTSYVTRE